MSLYKQRTLAPGIGESDVAMGATSEKCYSWCQDEGRGLQAKERERPLEAGKGEVMVSSPRAAGRIRGPNDTLMRPMSTYRAVR